MMTAASRRWISAPAVSSRASATCSSAPPRHQRRVRGPDATARRVQLGRGPVVGRLGRIDLGLGDDAVVAQLHLARQVLDRLVDGGGGILDFGLGDLDGRHGVFDVGVGALDRRRVDRQFGTGHGEFGLSLAHPGLEDRRVDPGDDLISFNFHIEIDEYLFDLSGYLRAYQYRNHGLEPACRGDRADERAMLDRGEAKYLGLCRAIRQEDGGDNADRQQCGSQGGDAQHPHDRGRPEILAQAANKLPVAQCTLPAAQIRRPGHGL